MNPKISIIVPVYNVEQYISQCLDSLVGQTMQDIEIICVDDCGTDNSIKIVQKYAKRDNRIKLISKEKNSGLSDSRNVGLNVATAPYVMFCDSDDFFAPNMCQKMCDAIHKYNADLAICGVNVIYEADENMRHIDDVYFRINTTGCVPLSEQIVYSYNVTTWNKIYKLNIIKEHKLLFPVGLKHEDEYFWRVYCLWAKNIVSVPEKLYNYRRRAGSIMSNVFKGTTTYSCDTLKIAIKYFEYLQANNLSKGKHLSFWRATFIPFYNTSIQRAKNPADINLANNLARDFIDQNYTRGTLDSHTNNVIQMIANGKSDISRKYIMGLIRINESTNTKKFRICGLNVYMVKYGTAWTKYYLFKLPLIKVTVL